MDDSVVFKTGFCDTYEQCSKSQLPPSSCSCSMWWGRTSAVCCHRDIFLLVFVLFCFVCAWSCPTPRSRGLRLTRLLCLRDFTGRSTGVGCHSLLQGIFLTQGLNLDLPHCRFFNIWATTESPEKLKRPPPNQTWIWQKLNPRRFFQEALGHSAATSPPGGTGEALSPHTAHRKKPRPPATDLCWFHERTI